MWLFKLISNIAAHNIKCNLIVTDLHVIRITSRTIIIVARVASSFDAKVRSNNY